MAYNKAMTSKLPRFSDAELKPTRDFLQDVSKILGKVQQVFVPADNHDWQKGLCLMPQGLATQPLTPQRLVLDMRAGELQTENQRWDLTMTTAQQLFAELSLWTLAQKGGQAPAAPDFSTSEPQFNLKHSQQLATVLDFVHTTFQAIGSGLAGGLVSPVLLYPHHFDVSLVWFFARSTAQVAAGFSTGDEMVSEPYFYVTASPEPAGFGSQVLPNGHWQTAGWHGAVLPYATVVASALSTEVVTQFITDLFHVAAKPN
ncbi:MAG: hypothetical protein JWS12_303 [Candidatus Saccharibacteria bacterium]|nr:hypothetical protein [Candidatus Saccharibacteria bacterium]